MKYRSLRGLFGIALFSLDALLAVACQPSVSPGAHSTPVGAPMPHVALSTMDGQVADLDSVRAGKPALVSFWATWCEACRKEFDSLNRLDERVKAGHAIVIGVNVGETSTVAAAFAKNHGLRYTQLVDEGFKLADALGQRQVPATVVIDREGRIVYSGGTLDERALVAFREAMGE